MMIYAAVALSVMCLSAVSVAGGKEDGVRKVTSGFVALFLGVPAVYLWVQVFT